MEATVYRGLPFVWAAVRLTQHQEMQALGHQSCNADR